MRLIGTKKGYWKNIWKADRLRDKRKIPSVLRSKEDSGPKVLVLPKTKLS